MNPHLYSADGIKERPNYGGAFHPFRGITLMDEVPKGGEQEDRYSQTTSYKPELASVGQP